jgi:hypothetical protein
MVRFDFGASWSLGHAFMTLRLINDRFKKSSGSVHVHDRMGMF